MGSQNYVKNAGLTYAEAIHLAKTAGEEVVPTFCAMCGPGPGCGIYAFKKEGRFTHVAGMSECPINKGSVCIKGQAAPTVGLFARPA